jgi:hypothetical protein
MATELNLPSITNWNGAANCVPGDNPADAANRAFQSFFPTDTGNPVVFIADNTNALKTQGSTTPTTAVQAQFKSQLAAAAAHVAMSANDKYMPASQVTSGTPTTAVLGNIVTETVANNFVPGQVVTCTGCTVAVNGSNTLSSSTTGYTITSATNNQFTFAFNNSNTTVATASETGATWSVSNPWTLTGTWAPVNMFVNTQVTSGQSQGISYQPGNILTIPCSVTNEQITITGVGPIGDLSKNVQVTATISGNVITALTGFTAVPVASGGTAYFNNELVAIYDSSHTAGGPTVAIVKISTSGANYDVTGVTLVSGGSGYTETSGSTLQTSNYGQLLNTGFTISQLGAGCTSVASFSIAATCA